MNPKLCYSVVLVDDSEDDRFFIKRAIANFPRFKIIQELSDGQEAINYMSGEQGFWPRTKFPLPDLLLLDLKMPRKSGYDVLHWLRTQAFPSLTVIVLSGSVLQEDVHTSLSLGAHGFWSKTSNLAQQRNIALEIEALLDCRTVSTLKERGERAARKILRDA